VYAGFGAAAFMGPLLQNLCLSMGNNEEACFCLKVRQQTQQKTQQKTQHSLDCLFFLHFLGVPKSYVAYATALCSLAL
jgi:hypothetical protein